MKLYIFITLFVFIFIFLMNNNKSELLSVKEHFESKNNVVDNDNSINKIIENQLSFIEYYIGRTDTRITFDIKTRTHKYKKLVSHLNLVLDTIIEYNNDKIDDNDNEQQTI